MRRLALVPLHALFALGFLAPGAAALQATEPLATALVHVTVVPMGSAEVLPDQTVVVRGDRIVAVSPASSADVPGGALVVDGRGKVLVPGLADMHVHLTDPRDGLLYVANGVTTIRNLSGQPFHLDLAEAYRRGDLIGPTLVTSGPQVRLPGEATAAEAELVVGEHFEAGYACVKLYGRMTLENYAAMASVARELGIPLVGHVPRNLTLEEVLEVGGHAEISHAEELLYSFFDRRTGDPNEVLPECVERLHEAGVAVTATLAVYAGIPVQVTDLGSVMARPEMRYVPPLGRVVFGPAFNKYALDFDGGDVARVRAGLATLLALTGAMDAAGVPVLLGTDAMNPAVIPGFSIHDELALLVQAGLEPEAALAAGTTRPAAFWHAEDEFGRVAPGLRADLVLLERNPLEDVARFREIAGVMVRGRWHSREELDAALEAQVAGYAAEAGAMEKIDRADPGPLLAAIAGGGEGTLPPEACFLSLAATYELIGNAEARERVLAFADARYPESVLLGNRMAEALSARGETEAGRARFERTLELDPDNRVAKRALGR